MLAKVGVHHYNGSKFLSLMLWSLNSFYVICSFYFCFTKYKWWVRFKFEKAFELIRYVGLIEQEANFKLSLCSVPIFVDHISF